jgi:hypothetical protein
VRKSFNSCNGQDLEETDESPISGTFENNPTVNIHLGAQTEITDVFVEAVGPQSEITTISNATFNSQTPFARALRQSRFELYNISTPTSRRSRSSRHTTLSINAGFVNPRGPLSQNLKDRGKFVWELCKLNYRMLISLTLTLFVAIFVSAPFYNC